jgi:hypothetical protein
LARNLGLICALALHKLISITFFAIIPRFRRYRLAFATADTERICHYYQFG